MATWYFAWINRYGASPTRIGKKVGTGAEACARKVSTVEPATPGTLQGPCYHRGRPKMSPTPDKSGPEAGRGRSGRRESWAQPRGPSVGGGRQQPAQPHGRAAQALLPTTVSTLRQQQGRGPGRRPPASPGRRGPGATASLPQAAGPHRSSRRGPALTIRSCRLSPSSLSTRPGAAPPSSPCSAESPDGAAAAPGQRGRTGREKPRDAAAPGGEAVGQTAPARGPRGGDSSAHERYVSGAGRGGYGLPARLRLRASGSRGAVCARYGRGAPAAAGAVVQLLHLFLIVCESSRSEDT